ncbi:pectate lyase family protein [Xylanibacter muris]|uniref:Pectate lyase n=1 Tax=Xylanibacter muris TaxID=2736290 RepID=A0ABX2AIU3_9BACT|nr:pectate lyase [Xylanibacter muris]NPD90983.1 pectate lyase [Xylanibacter muris]
MKNINKYILYGIVLCLTALSIQPAYSQTWDFSSLSSSDKTALDSDTENWTYDSSNNRWKNVTTYNKAPLKAEGRELELTRGLLITVGAADRVRIDMKKKSLTLNGANGVITIPGLKAGTKLTVISQSSSSSAARELTPTNLTVSEGFTASTSKITNIGTVTEDGEVTLTSSGGIYIFRIAASDGSDTPGPTPSGDHSATLNTHAVQAQLTTNGNVIKYYNPAELKNTAVNKTEGTVTVTPSEGEWKDIFTKTVTNIKFTKQAAEGENGIISNNGIEITEAKGWNETVYAKWNIYGGAQSYNVYVKGGQYTDFTKIDTELVRNYGSYARADVPGLKAGEYVLKVIPVINGNEDILHTSTASGLLVTAYDRSGFAHLNYQGIGAYNNDGTLKETARVIYVTAQTAKTVQLDVITGSNNKTETFTGLQAIINAYQKGLETRPLAVRLIGQIKDTDMDAFGSKAEGLQIKGRNNTIAMNITIEGVGEDATVWGFGFLLRNAVSVELRNFGIMLCMDDAVSMDTDNKHCWIHHLDLFYGKTGGDSDQAKGDGTIDVKGNSQYITISYNHMFDCGKSSLCGMKSETGPNYIDYHHNWFDHSDSRHPRVRTMTVHIWNNYYDGCSKYGAGATTGASLFVENNYFRNTKNPMLSSLQGTDAKGDGTFSGENGGMIKSFGNVYAEKGKSANYTPITHKDDATSFDCYEAGNRNEQVPPAYRTLTGGTTYNNFDIDASLMYKYSPLPADEIPSYVTGYYGAGRLNKGDFKYTFDNNVADTDYNVDKTLKDALENYRSSLVGIF